MSRPTDLSIGVGGIGVVAPEANDVEAFWARLHAPGTAAKLAPWAGDDIDHIPLGSRWGCFTDDAPLDALAHDVRRRNDRATQMFIVAAMQAFEMAGELPAGRGGVFVGRSVGDLAAFGADVVANTRTGRRPNPLTVPRVMPNATAAVVAKYLSIHGPAVTISTACASGGDAISAACTHIAAGAIDWAITGGADALVRSPHTLAAFQGLGVVTTPEGQPTARPFDTERDGFVMGEGAAALLLARSDESSIAHITGWSSTTDAQHLVAPDPTGTHASAAILNALEQAGLTPADVGAVIAHGTATDTNDELEASLYPALIPKAAITAPKAVTGHLMGASAALEVITAALVAQRGTVPPTANLASPIAPVANRVAAAPRPLTQPNIISTAFAFGGHNNAVLLTSKPGQSSS